MQKKFSCSLLRPFLLSLLAMFLTLGSWTSSAQNLYRWIDKDGRVIYSDSEPPRDAKDVQRKKLGDNVVANPNELLPFAVKAALQRNPVTLFASNCGIACDQALALLNKRGIPFSSRNPEADPNAAEALKSMVGQLNVPTLGVGTNSVVGFNENAWNNALDAAGYPRFNAASLSLKPATQPSSSPTPSPVATEQSK